MSRPVFVLIAGPNGSGKSTMTTWAKPYFQRNPVLDPDAVALQLQSISGHTCGPLEAGKELLCAAQSNFHRRVSFAVETTLSGRISLRMLEEAKNLDYQTLLIYISTQSIEINLERIRIRVLKGGHDVPESDQRRRHPRSLKNLPHAFATADECILLDNSSEEGPKFVAIKNFGGEVELFGPLPNWAEFLRRAQ